MPMTSQSIPPSEPDEPILVVRPYATSDEAAIVTLWQACQLTRSWNNPISDIARKLSVQPENFLVGTLKGHLIASVMAGFDGHRGWINYLAVSPACQGQHYGQQMMQAVEHRLQAMGCPKINLQIRTGNIDAVAFYQAIGYQTDDVISMGKRLISD